MSHTPIRIYATNSSTLFPGLEAHSLPFDLEPDRLVRTENFAECDVIPIMGNVDPDPVTVDLLKQYPNKLVFAFVFSHISEGDADNYEDLCRKWAQYTNRFAIVITDHKANKNHPKAHCYDFLFNRQKAYYYDYDRYVRHSAFVDKQHVHRLWSRDATEQMYQVPAIIEYQPHSRIKKFLVSNKNDVLLRSSDHQYLHERTMYRHLFVDYVRNHNECYYSDWSLTPPQTLRPQQANLMLDDAANFSGWWPVSNDFYTTSMISAYVETLVNPTQVSCITEKTFEPLLKGHFVLPFGYSGIVQDIVDIYGFKLPSWIDYSYDSEPDRTLRFCLYVKEFLRLRDQVGLSEMVELRNKDLDILHHNQQIFQQRPYHSLYHILRRLLDHSAI